MALTVDLNELFLTKEDISIIDNKLAIGNTYIEDFTDIANVSHWEVGSGKLTYNETYDNNPAAKSESATINYSYIPFRNYKSFECKFNITITSGYVIMQLHVGKMLQICTKESDIVNNSQLINHVIDSDTCCIRMRVMDKMLYYYLDDILVQSVDLSTASIPNNIYLYGSFHLYNFTVLSNFVLLDINSDYYSKSETYSQTEINSQLNNKAGLDTATSAKNGLMSSTDKNKLDNLTISDVSNLQSTLNNKAGLDTATGTTNGLMSSSDKNKLDNLTISDISGLQDALDLGLKIQTVESLDDIESPETSVLYLVQRETEEIGEE